MEASTCLTVKIGSLETERPYPIKHAQRVDTRFGPTVLLSIRDSDFTLRKVFLPRRYSEVVSDEDIDCINSGKAKLNLVYKGVCAQTNGLLLPTTGEEATE
jgi:hypothetical protein